MSAPSAVSDHLPLHPTEFRILLVLLGGPSHGYEIIRRIEEQGGQEGPIYPANLYRRIRRLLDAGLLEEVGPPPGEEAGHPPRRYVAVTGAGRAVARSEAARLRALLADAAAAKLLGPA